MWPPGQSQGGGCSSAPCHMVSPNEEEVVGTSCSQHSCSQAWDNENHDGQIPKSWIVCAVMPGFFQITELHWFNSMWHELWTVPPCSTWFHSAPFSSAWLGPGSPPPLCSLHWCCFSAQCLGAKAATFSEHVSKPYLGGSGKGRTLAGIEGACSGLYSQML